MQLINALAAGIQGAESGYARILIRGTTRRARYFRDFEGSDAVTNGQNVTLDANGGATIYVNVSVEVVVYDSSNQEVRRFVEAVTAACVEVISRSFTGADYETLAGGPGRPTTLLAVLDRLKTSFGAEDFKVRMPDGSKKTMRQALSAVTGVYYNVKSPLFGALGDGVTIDGPAIQEAIDAADEAGGGTVFIPAGTYMLGATQITVPYTVSILGAGSSVSVLRSAMTSDAGIHYNGGGDGIQTITGVKFHPTTDSSREIMELASGTKLSIRSSSFVVRSNSGYNGISAGAYTSEMKTQVLLEDCDFSIESAAGGAFLSLMDPRDGRCDIRMCRFFATATKTTDAVVTGANIHLYGCTFDNSDATTGTYTCVIPLLADGIYGSVRCCEFTDSGGAAVTCIYLGTPGYSTEWFTEDGNIFQANATNLDAYDYGVDVDTAYYMNLGTRESRYKDMALATTTVALTDVINYGIISVRSTGVGNFTLTADSLGPLGARLRVLFVNGNGSTRTLSMGTNMKGGTFTIATNEAIGLEFVSAVANNGAGVVKAWFLVGTSGALISGADSSYAV